LNKLKDWVKAQNSTESGLKLEMLEKMVGTALTV
jgi:hypothetical protein